VVKTVFAAITTLPNTTSDVVFGTARSLPISVANNDDRDVADSMRSGPSSLTGLLLTYSGLEDHCSFVHCTHIFTLISDDLLTAIECQAGRKKRHRTHVAMNRNPSRRTADG
jgi:hypothetical protein